MITIINKQRKIPINKPAIKAIAQEIISFLKYTDFDLGILFVNNATMRDYNNQYRSKDKPTDILSFPFYPDLKAGEYIQASSAEEKNLGDLIIAPEYVMQDAKQYEQTYDERIKILLVHGVCHLLGYDHITDTDYEIMHKEEERILRHLKKSDL